jgi:HlyD family secretion protein
MNRKKLFIGLGIVLVLAGMVYANFAFKRTTGIEVNVEKIQRRDLEAQVSASGKIQPKTSVNISAETMGKVTRLAVEEGDFVKKGQFLLEIDPRNLQTAVDNMDASLASNMSVLEETRGSRDSAKLALDLSQANMRRAEDLYKKGLMTRSDYESAQNDLKMKETDLKRLEQSLKTQDTRIRQAQAMLDSANYDLTKVRIVSPIDGLVTLRSINLGETAVTGTMNNAGTVLLTVADMSVIQAEIEVDETDIPFVAVGQPGKVKIDAFPDKEFDGHVTEVGHSPITTAGATTATRATDFKVVVVLDGRVPDVRPGFTCTGVITTATRTKATAVPIQATTVREVIVDQTGQIVRDTPSNGPNAPRRPAGPQEPKPGQARKELEGVFVVKDGKAIFTPIKSGIAGEKYFEVLDGLKEGDEVITGPFSSVRTLKDGDAVKITTGTTVPNAAKS